MQPELVALEDAFGNDDLDEDFVNYLQMVQRDKLIRIFLTFFTAILVVTAPIVSYLYPSTWNIILSTALAFTIGTNLLISVVTVKVESKAQQLEERMQLLVRELNQTAERMMTLHETLNIANIPGAVNLFETVKNEFIPGFRSLEDLDLEMVVTEIKRASNFAETLDTEKIRSMILQFTKEDVEPGQNPYEVEQPVLEMVFSDDDFEFDDDDVEEVQPSTNGFVFNRDELLQRLSKA